ncbi:Sulfite reductase [NADPH] hemoprotein beta-component [Grifola frondosa]|uniref:Sulfite reductase [NADPH] hemoprotein beta-component n=1 Tax=Grifola frondosa TaxID=5627 RepID=A0A1C7LVF1_GRIFR|nr:Sulfite reductase [NADPH] hemoprotein beta-component [Grifola frondosa]
MGKSQNHREVLGPFLLKNSDDPAVMNFLPKLRQHLLPRIQAKLREEDAVNAISDRNGTGVEDLNDAQVSEDQNCVLFKNDCIYRHYILRLNYMTYDVRRAQDVINPNTSHRDVMGLVEIEGEQHGIHPFWYARVLGIFHVDVVYTGSGMLDFRSRRMDFLWVRWFQVIDDVTINWSGLKMDLLRFVPMYDEDAFGFIDPADILRGCHIIPAYTHGQMHADGIGLSSIAQDASDAQKYYVNRFVDRDMIMRYYWGMAVGHTYARRSAVSSSTPSEAVEQDLTVFQPIPNAPEHANGEDVTDHDDVPVDSPEWGLDNREDDDGATSAEEGISGGKSAMMTVVAVPEIAISDTVVVAPIVESSQDDQSAGLPSISTSDADLVTKVIVVVDIEEAESSSPASVRSIPTVESPEQHMDFEEKLESPVIATTEAGEGVAKSAFLSMVAVPEIPERPKSPWTPLYSAGAVAAAGQDCRRAWGDAEDHDAADSQFHGVIKRHLKAVIQDINHALLDTLAVYGDINRNVISPPPPLPGTTAYHEIWLEKKLGGAAPSRMSSLYGEFYLPGKFKGALTVPSTKTSTNNEASPASTSQPA